jgi:hypothetical protein
MEKKMIEQIESFLGNFKDEPLLSIMVSTIVNGDFGYKFSDYMIPYPFCRTDEEKSFWRDNICSLQFLFLQAVMHQWANETDSSIIQMRHDDFTGKYLDEIVQDMSAFLTLPTKKDTGTGTFPDTLYIPMECNVVEFLNLHLFDCQLIMSFESNHLETTVLYELYLKSLETFLDKDDLPLIIQKHKEMLSRLKELNVSITHCKDSLYLLLEKISKEDKYSSLKHFLDHRADNEEISTYTIGSILNSIRECEKPVTHYEDSSSSSLGSDLLSDYDHVIGSWAEWP